MATKPFSEKELARRKTYAKTYKRKPDTEAQRARRLERDLARYKLNPRKQIKKPLTKVQRERRRELERLRYKARSQEKSEKQRLYLKSYRGTVTDDQKNHKRQYNKAWFLSNKKRLYDLRHTRVSADASLRLKSTVSSRVWAAMKGNKNGASVWKHFPYTFEELKEHVESLFENWMTWDNRGHYVVESWDDNDPTTWTWHLDHIIPHSRFAYTSMDSKEFQECWSLSNLRPLSAKQNIRDGARRPTRQLPQS